jgi:hypothetical protein
MDVNKKWLKVKSVHMQGDPMNDTILRMALAMMLRSGDAPVSGQQCASLRALLVQPDPWTPDACAAAHASIMAWYLDTHPDIAEEVRAAIAGEMRATPGLSSASIVAAYLPRNKKV